MKNAVVLHHSDIPFNRPQRQEIIRYHLNNPKIGQAGAYTYLIERSPDGQVEQLHDEEFIGFHAGNYEVNKVSIGICLAGDFTQQSPTEAQIDSLFHLLQGIQQRWGIPDERIFHHGEVRLWPTACPGIDLRAIYFARREKDREKKIRLLQQALHRAKGSRLLRVKRTLDRLLNTP